MIAADKCIEKEVDIFWTLIPNEPTIIAAPNNCRFISRHVSHADKYQDMHASNVPPSSSSKRPESKVDSIEVPIKKNTFIGNSTGKTYAKLTKTGKSNGKTVKVSVIGYS